MDEQPRARRWTTLACCVALAMVDGFDVQSIGFAGPAILQAWHLPAPALGPLLSAGLFGSLLGTLSLGVAGDRFGRVRVLAATVILFSIGTAATAFAGDRPTLIVLRVLTGVALGGALPNLLALASEQVPPSLRATGVSLVLVGAPLGASLGGAGSVALMQAHGWPAVFIVASLVPLPFLALLLALAGGRTPTRREPVPSGDGPAPRDGVLAPHYRAGTLLLWLAGFFSVMLTYTLTGWLPTLLTLRGFTVAQAVLATALLNLGSVIGGLLVGRLSDLRRPFGVVCLAYALGSGAMALIGACTGIMPVLLAIAATALLVLGGQTGIGSLSATFYAPHLRGAGVGFTAGIGRLGAVAGPLLVALLLGLGVGVPRLFLIAGAVALGIAAIMYGMGLAVQALPRPAPPLGKTRAGP